MKPRLFWSLFICWSLFIFMGRSATNDRGMRAEGQPPLPPPLPPSCIADDITQPRSFLHLSDELHDLVGCALLADSGPRDALRFCQVCQVLRTKLERLHALVEERRLRWLPELTAEHAISDEGGTLTCTRPPGSDDIHPWVAGRLLPTLGTSMWTIRVVRSKMNDGNGMWIGVCDAAARWAWGLFLYSGRLRRISRDAHGRMDLEAVGHEGFPNGNYKQVIKDSAGRPASLRGQATGALIKVTVDHDAGTMSYRINGGARLVALQDEDGTHLRNYGSSGFPQGAALRPYCACYYPGDCIRFDPSVLSVVGAA